MAAPVALRPLWTVDDLARYLRVSKRTITRRVADGSLPAVRTGRLVRFDPERVVEALADRDDR
jgi:excisionase family DNA binding protein